MTNVIAWRGRCAGCGAEIGGFADPTTSATVPEPGPGEKAVCLACLALSKPAAALTDSLTELPE